jgi:hypothetical protein
LEAIVVIVGSIDIVFLTWALIHYRSAIVNWQRTPILKRMVYIFIVTAWIGIIMVIPQLIWVTMLQLELNSTAKEILFYIESVFNLGILVNQLTIRHKYSMSLGILSRKTLIAIAVSLIALAFVSMSIVWALPKQNQTIGSSDAKLLGAILLFEQFLSGTHLAFTIRHMASTNQSSALALLRNPRYFVRLLAKLSTHVLQVLFCRTLYHCLCRHDACVF